MEDAARRQDLRITLPAETAKRLRHLAIERGLSLSDLVAEAIAPQLDALVVLHSPADRPARARQPARGASPAGRAIVRTSGPDEPSEAA